VMNSVKTKARNRLKTDMLCAILRLRVHLHVMNICCDKFKPSPKMFKKFTSNMYNSGKCQENNKGDDEISEFLVCQNNDDIPCLNIIFSRSGVEINFSDVNIVTEVEHLLPREFSFF
jgi:hypothetical protein